MIKTISTTWPWNDGITPEKIVLSARDLRAGDVCLRTPVYQSPYGDSSLPYYQGKNFGPRTDNRAIEETAKAAGLSVSIWPVLNLNGWAAEAQVIQSEVQRYRPSAVFLDAEGSIVKYINNLGPFLRALGKLPAPTYLQSYRRAELHMQMRWNVWYSYRDQDGRYIIDGHGHQLYPIGKTSVAGWLDDFKKSVASHETEAKRVGRVMPWYPTLPTFVSTGYEGVAGWIPPVDAFLAALEWMQAELGERLVGINLWSLDRHLLDDRLHHLYLAVKAISSEPPAPAPLPPPQTLSLEERVARLEAAVFPIDGGAS